MRNYLAAAAAVLLAAACRPGTPAAAPGRAAVPAVRAESLGFVTRLGGDTLAIERMVLTPTGARAEVLLRSPAVLRTMWALDMDGAGTMTRLEGTTTDVGTGQVVRREAMVRTGDSATVTVEAAGAAAARASAAIALPPATLPFIDLVHWPYELVLRRARAMSVDTVRQPLLAGTRVMVFPVGRSGTNGMSLTHPLRGTMDARVDDAGRLQSLDAARTTRKVVVERVPWPDMDAAARSFAGRPVGELSGRGEARATVAGATFTLDYGTPARRGREIWGALVPYGQLWRTGANRATGFTVDRDIELGGLRVPAGSYTLFSIPQAGGGLLIVNRQTGQAGTSYDQARDLGRVPLARRALAAPVEQFTIRVEPTAAGGELRLQWGDAELVAPFRVPAR